jgi:hypothetical protein
MYIDLFGNPVPVAQPKPRKRSNANDNANDNRDDHAALYEESSSSSSSTSSVSRSLRDLGIHGQEAAFYTAMRQATKMAPHSIRCVIDALAQYAATCLAEERPAKIPGLCTVTAKPVAERTTQVASPDHVGTVRRTIPAHRKVKLKPAPDLVRMANAQRERGSLEFKARRS